MEIKVYNPDLQRVGVLETASVVRITRRLFKPGFVEVVLHPGAHGAELLTHDNIIMMGSDPERCGVIQRVELTGKLGEELMTVQGYTLEGILSQYLTVPPSVTEQYYEGWDRIRGPAETVMKHYVNTQCINPERAERANPYLALAPDLGRGVELPW